MQHRRITEIVNLKVVPTPRTKPENIDKQELSLGDLHGNVMTLIYQLVHFGVITNMTPETYQKLCDIYYGKDGAKPTLTKETIAEFKKLVLDLTYDLSILARLLGDETADRGFCDIFQLLQFLSMRRKHLPYEILLSNHGVEFIRGYEENDFSPVGIMDYHAKSMLKLQDLLFTGIVTEQEVTELIDEAYKPALKVLSYTLYPEKNTIMLFSHAGIGISGESDEVIPALARLFKVEFNDSSIEKLAATIDAINAAFQVYVQGNRVREIYNFKLIASNCTISPKYNPLEFLTWNRDYSKISRPAKHPKHDYHLLYCHGHDSNGPNADHVFVLNEWLGIVGFEKHTMAVLTSHSVQPALELEVTSRRASF